MVALNPRMPGSGPFLPKDPDEDVQRGEARLISDYYGSFASVEVAGVVITDPTTVTILLTRQQNGGTLGHIYAPRTEITNTKFQIRSTSELDTSNVYWAIIQD